MIKLSVLLGIWYRLADKLSTRNHNVSGYLIKLRYYQLDITRLFLYHYFRLYPKFSYLLLNIVLYWHEKIKVFLLRPYVIIFFYVWQLFV